MNKEPGNSYNREPVYLVATKTPKGMKIHTELGVRSSSPVSLKTMKRRKIQEEMGLAMDPILEEEVLQTGERVKYVLASTVGLEWHRAGEKIPVSGKWADKSWVAISEIDSATDE